MERCNDGLVIALYAKVRKMYLKSDLCPLFLETRARISHKMFYTFSAARFGECCWKCVYSLC